MKFDCWTQAADFSIKEHHQQSLENSLALFNTCNWETMIEFEWELVEKKVEYAPPGFGIIHPEGHDLHLCPDPANNSCWICYKPRLDRKLLGFIPWFDPRYESDDLKFTDAPRAIEIFCGPDPHGRFLDFLYATGVIDL